MAAPGEQFVLSNGVVVPPIGFGTWQIPEGPAAFDAVSAALAAGYRHIDTARGYGNESSVGKAIAASGLDRSDVFVTTKLPASVKTYDGALESFDTTSAALGTHVDLYLIHGPWPFDDIGGDYTEGNAEAWRAMEEIYDSGRARSIGISNFKVPHIEALLRTARVTPHADQIRFFIGNTQRETTDLCQRSGILVQGYSPLATGAIVDNADLAAMAAGYGRTVAQLCIRYVLQNDVLPLPKTVSPARMAENADVDFEINAADMATLDGLDTT